MQYYSAKIRLSGSVQNEVRRTGLSAPEIGMLRFMHGDDAVLEIAPSDAPVLSEDLAAMNERGRLEFNYGEKQVEKVFGPRHLAAKLPLYLPEFEDTGPAPEAPKAVRKRRTREEIEADKKAVAAESKQLETVMD